MKRQSRIDSRGFTLVEMIAVLTVSGLIMLAAIPNLHRANDTWKLKESISTIEMSMRRARSTAATERVQVRVTVDAMNRECIVEIDTDDDGAFDTEISRTDLHQSVTVESIDFGGAAAIVFDERGAPDNPGSVILRSQSGFAREVMVAAGSGSVQILEVLDEEA